MQYKLDLYGFLPEGSWQRLVNQTPTTWFIHLRLCLILLQYSSPVLENTNKVINMILSSWSQGA